MSAQDPELLWKAALAEYADAYRKSLFALAKFGLGYSAMTERTHMRTVRALESPKRKKLVVMPRGTFKSSLASVAFPVWLLINNPNLRILIDSEVYTNSKNFLREIRNHLMSDHMVEVFGKFESNVWSEAEIIIAQRTKNLKEASITCGGIGTVKVGQHYDVIIHDDLNSDNNSQTTEACDKVYKHYQMNDAILEPGGIWVVVGTRYSEADVIGRVMRDEIGMDEPQE